jgi:hypothetical protein
MALQALLNKKKKLFWVIALIVFSAFAADIIDLREDIRMLPTPYSSLDNSVMTGITDTVDLAPTPLMLSGPVFSRSSVNISFLHLLPFGFRAPPSWS